MLVVGAGPAGLSAALAAAQSGARVIIADEGNEPGGLLRATGETLDGAPAEQWLMGTVAQLDAMPNVRRLADTIVSGYYDHNFLTLLERRPEETWLHERLIKLRAREVVRFVGRDLLDGALVGDRIRNLVVEIEVVEQVVVFVVTVQACLVRVPGAHRRSSPTLSAACESSWAV